MLPILGGGALCMPLCFWGTQTAVAAADLITGAGRSQFTPYLPTHTAATAIQQVYRSYLRNKPYRLQVAESAFSFEVCSDEVPFPGVIIPGTTAAIMADFALLLKKREADRDANFALLLGKHFSVQICGH
jgi:hypothetical protein